MNRRSLKIAVPTAALLFAGVFGVWTATAGSAGPVPINPPGDGAQPAPQQPAPTHTVSPPTGAVVSVPSVVPSRSPTPKGKKPDQELCGACA